MELLSIKLSLSGKFYGFDYVLSPNFTKNRGFTLDSTAKNELTLDSVYIAAQEERDQFFQQLIEKQEQEIKLISASLDSATMDNEELLGMLCKLKENVEKASARL